METCIQGQTLDLTFFSGTYILPKKHELKKKHCHVTCGSESVPRAEPYSVYHPRISPN